MISTVKCQQKHILRNLQTSTVLPNSSSILHPSCKGIPKLRVLEDVDHPTRILAPRLKVQCWWYLITIGHSCLRAAKELVSGPVEILKLLRRPLVIKGETERLVLANSSGSLSKLFKS